MNKQISQHLCLWLSFFRDHYRSWLGLSILGSVFQWDDGTIVDYLPWDYGEPDYPEKEYQFCVHQDDDTIRDASPWYFRYAVCQMGTGSASLVDDQK